MEFSVNLGKFPIIKKGLLCDTFRKCTRRRPDRDYVGKQKNNICSLFWFHQRAPLPHKSICIGAVMIHSQSRIGPRPRINHLFFTTLLRSSPGPSNTHQ